MWNSLQNRLTTVLKILRETRESGCIKTDSFFCEQTINEEESLEPALIQDQPNERILHYYRNLEFEERARMG